jgi:hypothetical protein
MLFDNNWFNWFLSNYSILIAFIPVAMTFILKLIAILNPNVPSDQICELINQYWRRK